MVSVQLIARGTVCVIAAALLASTGSGVNAQAVGRVPDADFVSLHPHEAKLPIDRLGSEVTPVAPLTLINLLSCLTSLTLRNYPQAIAACDRAIVLDPDNPGGYKLRGEAYFFTARYEEAIADFKRSLSLDATDPETHSGLGATYRVLHAYAQATREFDRAIALAPDDERYLNGRCWTRAEWNHKLRLALADCTKALALAPDLLPPMTAEVLCTCAFASLSAPCATTTTLSASTRPSRRPISAGALRVFTCAECATVAATFSRHVRSIRTSIRSSQKSV